MQRRDLQLIEYPPLFFPDTDTQILQTILLCLPYWGPEQHVVNYLKQRTEPPQNIPRTEAEQVANMMYVIQARVFRFLHMWITEYWERDFLNSPALIQHISELLSTSIQRSISGPASALLKKIDTMKRIPPKPKKMTPAPPLTAPSQQLVDFQAKQVAQQLVLWENNATKLIPVSDLVKGKGSSFEMAIFNSSQLTRVVSSTLCRAENVDQAIKIITFWAEIEEVNI